MKSLTKRLDCIIDNFEIDINGKSNSIITVHDVVEGISQVKHNKKDGYGVVYTDHFLMPHIRCLFICHFYLMQWYFMDLVLMVLTLPLYSH